MGKTLIINIAMPIWIGGDTNSHIYSIYHLEREYKKAKYNSNFDIYIFQVKFQLINNQEHYVLIKLKYEQNLENINEGKFVSQEITNPILDIGSAEGIKALLKEVDYLNEGYTKRILGAFSHGFGYSIFSQEITSDDELFEFIEDEKHYEIIESSKNFEKHQIVGEYKFDKGRAYQAYLLPQKPTVLTMKELAMGLKIATVKEENKTLDAIIFANCFMQTADTVYALKDYCKYIIGAETIFSWEAYDFKLLVDDEIENDYEKYLKNFLKGSFEFIREGLDQTKTVSNEQIALSLIRTKDVDSFFLALHNIIIFFIEHIENDVELFDDFKNTLSYCYDVTGEFENGIVDIMQFFNNFQKSAKNNYPVLDNNLNLIKTLLVDSVFRAIFPGKNFKQPFPEVIGMSINLPANPAIEDIGSYYRTFSDTDSRFQSDFSKDNHWGTFLKILENMYL